MPATESTTATRALRVTSDSMYDPANPRDLFFVNDKVIVDSEQHATDGDFVIVSREGSEYLMRLTTRDGERLYKYMAPELSAVCFTDDEVIVTGVVTERYREFSSSLRGPLKWRGDDIGLCNDSLICVCLIESNGRDHFVSLREALMAANQLDDYGLQRITTALESSAEEGYLRPMDLAVWNEFKSDREFNTATEVRHE